MLINFKVTVGIILAFMLLLSSSVYSVKQSYKGRIGDNISYRDGTLSLSSTDVSIPGKNGLDVNITRYYSSRIYNPAKLDFYNVYYGHRRDLGTVKDPIYFDELGLGWHMNFPFLLIGNNGDNIVYSNGEYESMFNNIDTLTLLDFPQAGYDSVYTKKIRSLALLTSLADTLADTMLTSDGMKLVFGHIVDSAKYMSMKINKYGDTLKVEYHSNTSKIKRVISPIGQDVKFYYDTLAYESVPSATDYVSKLEYKNYLDSTLSIRYEYGTYGGNEYLTKIFYPAGDSTVYDYTNYITKNNDIDWTEINEDDFSYSNDIDTTLSVYFISKITDPTGAYAEYKYRFVNMPLFGRNAEYCLSYGCTNDNIYNFNVSPGVYERRENNTDSLIIQYELSWEVITDNSLLHLAPIFNTVHHPSGGIEKYQFNVSYFREYDPDYFAVIEAAVSGYEPGALFLYASIFDNDTNTIGYGYPHYDRQIIGISYDTLVDTSRLCDDIDDCDTTITTYDDSSFIYKNYRYFEHFDVTYMLDQYGWAYPLAMELSKQRRTSFYQIVDYNSGGLPIYSITGQRNDTLEYQLYSNPWGAMEGCFKLIPIDSSVIYYSPDVYATDSFSYVKDSVLEYVYVPKMNKAYAKKIRHSSVKSSGSYAYVEELEYDTTYYQIIETRTYNECDTTKIFTTTIIYNDTTHNLQYKISPFGDTTTYIYDTLYHQVLVAELNSRVDDTLYKKDYYFPFLKLKSRTDINGATTYYYYDFYGRDSLMKYPLEDNYSIKYEYNTDSMWNASYIKIDSGVEQYTRSFLDVNLQPVKSMIKVNDSISIIDSTVYSSYGEIVKTARPVYDEFDSTNTIWTENVYNQDHTLSKTYLPDGDSVYFEKVDELTNKAVDRRGQTKVNISNYDGQTLTSLAITTPDSNGYTDTLISTFEYDQYDNVTKTTLPSGMVREYEYDDYGRRNKVIDPDVGTIRTWYDRFGKIRFIQHNDEDTLTYFKYDELFRLIEEGGIINPDTTMVDSINYPSTGTYGVISYRYDDYSSGIADDTTGGLSNSKGRLTQIEYATMYYIAYFYDARGRIRLKTETIPGMSPYSDSAQYIYYDYYDNNTLKRITYPDSTFTEYSYDAVGRTNGISDIIGIDSIGYEPWGPINEVTYTNGVRTYNEFDSLSQLTKTRSFNTMFTYFSREYKYDKGFITAEYDIDTLGDTTTYGMVRQYGYDKFNRLDTAYVKDPNGTAPARTCRYDYDLNNNLNYKVITGIDSLTYTRYDSLNCDSIWQFGNDSCYAITKNDRGQITRLEKYDSGTPSGIFTYQRNFQYNFRGQLHRIIDEQAAYLRGDKPDTVFNYYNPFGQKVYQSQVYRFKQEGTLFYTRVFSEKYYLWSGSNVIAEYDSNHDMNAVNIYGLGKRMARKVKDLYGWSTKYYLSDYHGSVRSYVRSNGVPDDWRIEYYPYGDIYSLNGMNRTPHYFIGKEKDKTGELDFGPRYYSVTGGRFLAPDPILSGPSPYAYADGNPIMKYDPTGYLSISGAAVAEWIANTMAEQGLETWDEYTDYMRAQKEAAEHEWKENIRRQIAFEMELLLYRDYWQKGSNFYYTDEYGGLHAETASGLIKVEDIPEGAEIDAIRHDVFVQWRDGATGEHYGPRMYMYSYYEVDNQFFSCLDKPGPGWDPTKPPGEGYKWKGDPPVGGKKGNWYNEDEGKSYHPDLDHPAPDPPHWDVHERGKPGKTRIDPDTGEDIDAPKTPDPENTAEIVGTAVGTAIMWYLVRTPVARISIMYYNYMMTTQQNYYIPGQDSGI